MIDFSFQFLGQAGVLLQVDEHSSVIDPYLSNSVGEKYGAEFERQVPIPVCPNKLESLGLICLTHAHLDHADPATLIPLAAASPRALFLAPFEVAKILAANGIPEPRVHLASEYWITIAPGFSVRAVPAAHLDIERDVMGRLRYCGYLFKVGETLIYHAGDTMPHPEIVSTLLLEGDLEIAFLPCNERNVYRERAGIIGNMSIREMLAFAAELRARQVVVLHWDMFFSNSVMPEEIAVVTRHDAPELSLLIPRAGVWYNEKLREI